LQSGGGFAPFGTGLIARLGRSMAEK